jgi:hypothetical protein
MTTVSLTGNFLAAARCLTFGDSASVTWAFNKNTNTLTATSAGGGGSGTVTSVAAGASGNIVIGGTPTVAPTVDLSAGAQADLALAATALQSIPNTVVTPGSYTYTSLTVGADGRLTAAANGTQPVTSITSATLTVAGTTAAPTVNLSSTQVTDIGLGGTSLQPIGSLNGSYTNVNLTLNTSGQITAVSNGSSGAAISPYPPFDFYAAELTWEDQQIPVLGTVYPTSNLQVNGLLNVYGNVTLGAATANGNTLTILGTGPTITAPTSSAVLTVNANFGQRFQINGTNFLTIGSGGGVSILNGATSNPQLTVTAPNSASVSEGITVVAGTNSSDWALKLIAASSGTLLVVRGDGVVTVSKSPVLQATTSVMTGLVGLRTTNNTITSSTALTADTSLQVTLNETGTYRVEGVLFFSEATLGTGGFQFDLGGGAATVSSIAWSADGFATALIGAAATTSATVAQQFATISTSATAPSYATIAGTVVISVAGTFGVRVAQVASSANATTVQPNSHIILTKIG